MTDQHENPWQTLRSTRKYRNRWIEVVEHDVLNPKKQPALYGTIHFRNTGVGVLPIDAEGCTWLVGQYRYALGQYSWEIPEGGAPLDEDPLAAARRELKEETGLEAEGWREILGMHLSNSVSDEFARCFLAWNLRQGEAEPEDSEQLQLRRLPFSEALAMVDRGEITDAIAVAAILRVQLMLLSRTAPEPVQKALAPG